MESTRLPSGRHQDDALNQRLRLVSTICALTMAAFAITRLLRWLWVTVGFSNQDVLSRASWIAASDRLFGDGFIALVVVLALGSAARYLATGATFSTIEQAALIAATVWGALGIVANIGTAGIVMHSWQTDAEAAGAYELSPGWSTAGFAANAALSAVLLWGAQQLLHSGSPPTRSATNAH